MEAPQSKLEQHSGNILLMKELSNWEKEVGNLFKLNRACSHPTESFIQESMEFSRPEDWRG